MVSNGKFKVVNVEEIALLCIFDLLLGKEFDLAEIASLRGH